MDTVRNLEVTAFCYFPFFLLYTPLCVPCMVQTVSGICMHLCMNVRMCVCALLPRMSPGKTPDLIRLVQPPAVSCVSVASQLVWLSLFRCYTVVFHVNFSSFFFSKRSLTEHTSALKVHTCFSAGHREVLLYVLCPLPTVSD